jgi:hypothetical protein
MVKFKLEAKAEVLLMLATCQGLVDSQEDIFYFDESEPVVNDSFFLRSTKGEEREFVFTDAEVEDFNLILTRVDNRKERFRLVTRSGNICSEVAKDISPDLSSIPKETIDSMYKVYQEVQDEKE